MNIDALAAELLHARQSGADAILSKRDMGMSVAPHPLASFANHLTEELAKNGLPQPIYLTDPQSLGLIEPLFLATWLLQRAVALSSELEAINAFSELVSTNRRRMRYVSVVKGVQVLEPVSISERITLHPESFLAETERYRSGRLHPHLSGHHGSFGCVAVYEFEQKGIFLAQEAVEKQDHGLYQQITGDINSLISLLPLVSGSGAIAVVSWFEFHEEESIPIRSTGFSYPLDGSLPFSCDLVLAEPLKNVFGLHQGLSQGTKDHIAIPLDRLNRSRRQNGTPNAAIDLGIALESLLMDDHDGKSEISFKMAMRAAFLLGHNAEERKKIFDAVRDVYDLRSAAVHTGRLPSGKKRKDKPTATDAIRRGQTICAELIRQCMHRNDKIGWDDILFGAE